MSEPRIHFEVLPNGLTALLCESHHAPVVEVQVWACTGSADERPGEEGLAHFHEHMLFKGTERRAVGELAGEVEGAGGRMNAYTSFDVTAYHATLPSDRLSVGVDVLADAIQHSSFDPVEIDREIEVVLEEIRRSEDSPAHVLSEAVFATCYECHPYRAPILGSVESVSGFDRARVRAFFERWYTPEHLMFVGVGDFDPTALMEEVRLRFGERPRGSAQRQRPSEPLQRKLRSVVLGRPFERTNVELCYPAVSLGHPDAPLLDLLAFVLGCGDSSRLVHRIKESEALVERVDASCYTPYEPGLFSIAFESDAGRATDALAACVREVERVRREPVTADELEKARDNFLASEHFERESVTGVAHKLGGFQALAGDYRAESRYLDSIRRATAEDLLDVARRHLLPERLTVGAVTPEPTVSELDHAAIEAAVARGVERVERAYGLPVENSTARPIHSYELPGGAALHVHPRRDVPVVAARAAFLGGLLAETDEEAGLSSFLTSMWLRGTRSHSAVGFARASEGLATEIDGFSGRSSLGLTLEAPADRLEPALDLFAEVLLEPAFEPEQIERERRDTLAAIERREDRLAQVAFLLFARTHYRTHPYRHPMLGTAESVARFDRRAVVAHHERLIRAPNLVLAIAGDVDPDEVAQRVSSRLAELPAGDFVPPSPPVEDAPAEIRHGEVLKDRAQAHLVIGFRGVTVEDPDRHALEVISQLLSGQGGRLFLELRDRQSLAYSVNASNVEGLAPGFFSVYIATAPEKVDQAREGLLGELRGLLGEPPGEAELERARRNLSGNFLIAQQRNATHAAHIALDARYGLGADAAHRYAEQVGAVTREDVLRVARRIIRLDAYTEALVHP